jgi:hypothetical protein
MSINKSLNIGVKRAHKQGDWLGFDAVEVIPKSLKDSVNNGDYGKIAQAKIDKINDLLRTEGSKINESIDDAKLQDQINFITNYRDNERKKLEATTKQKVDWVKTAFNGFGLTGKVYANLTPREIQIAHEQEIQADALDVVLQAMLKEQKLRDAINTKIDVAKREDTLDSWNKIKDAWRSLEQKKVINENIQRVQAVVKASQEAAKVEAAKQAKLDALNKQLAGATNQKEKEAIASQISDLMGTVSEQTGMPKGYLYIGIGVAVVVGIWITLRAIRK